MKNLPVLTQRVGLQRVASVEFAVRVYNKIMCTLTPHVRATDWVKCDTNLTLSHSPLFSSSFCIYEILILKYILRFVIELNRLPAKYDSST